MSKKANNYKDIFEREIEAVFKDYKYIGLLDNDILFWVKFQIEDGNQTLDYKPSGVMVFSSDTNTFSFLVPNILIFSRKNADSKAFYEKMNKVNQQLISGGFYIAKVKEKKSVYYRWSRTMEEEDIRVFLKKCISDAVEELKSALSICVLEFAGNYDEEK